MSTLYIVATPIGNLDDISLRAIKTLKEVDVIACEDTRHTQTMLTHLEITGKRLIACHAHNEAASSQGIINLMEQGLSVAYCSDAGTPGVSDPGSRLVRAVREAGFTVVPIPGASASVTLISASGLAGNNTGNRFSVCQGHTIFGLTSTSGTSVIKNIGFYKSVSDFEVETGVSGVDSSKSQTNVYGIDGRRRSVGQRGVFIANGKKYLSIN